MYKGNEDLNVYMFSQGHVYTCTVSGLSVDEFTGDIKALFQIEPFIGITKSEKGKKGYNFGKINFYELHPDGKQVEVLEIKPTYVKHKIANLKKTVEGNIISNIESFNTQLENQFKNAQS